MGYYFPEGDKVVLVSGAASHSLKSREVRQELADADKKILSQEGGMLAAASYRLENTCSVGRTSIAKG